MYCWEGDAEQTRDTLERLFLSADLGNWLLWFPADISGQSAHCDHTCRIQKFTTEPIQPIGDTARQLRAAQDGYD